MAAVDVDAVVGARKLKVGGGLLLADAEAAREDGVAVVGGDGHHVVAGVDEFGVAVGEGGAVVDVVVEGGEGGVVGVDGAFGEAGHEVLHLEAVGLPAARAVGDMPVEAFGLGAEYVELEDECLAGAEGEDGGGLFVAEQLRPALEVEFDGLHVVAPGRVGKDGAVGVERCKRQRYNQ